MPKKSKGETVEVAAADVVEKEKQISSSKSKKPGSEIDDIFAGKKRKKPELQEKSSGDAVSEPKKLKKNKVKGSRIPKDNVLSEQPRRSRKKTADGFTLYTEEELGIGRSNAGGISEDVTPVV
ncbi:uncharacterized protein LOC129882018 isoform X2 [Solanum dulcamara]|uniref:uncharacterized protein LOC129882018 isoform X2 n=1 Tax=Solanum dulcamara TaxID=45834 RepID=UPI002486BAB0|nr:uncharacterized protein LOC129882018 isoform X2 [Solanum dulcamara]